MTLYDMKLNFGPFQPIFPSETLKNAPYDCKQNVPPVEYTSWMSGEPNNVAEGCVINNFHQPKKWIDATCVLGPEVPHYNVPTGFFCEMDAVDRGVKTELNYIHTY